VEPFRFVYGTLGFHGTHFGKRWSRVKRKRTKSRKTPTTKDIFIQVTCNMNAKGRTRNENIWTMTRAQRKEPELTT